MPCFADAVTMSFLVIIIKYAIAKAVNQISKYPLHDM